MNHKLTLWPSIAAVLIWVLPFGCSHWGEEKIAPPPIVPFRLLEPGSGIPGIPDLPPVLPARPKNLTYT